MPQDATSVAFAAGFGAAALAAALFHRAVASASPARLEELNDNLKSYAALPDLADAAVVSGALKVAMYAMFVSAVTRAASGNAPGAPLGWTAAATVALAGLAICEALALVAAGYHSGRMLYRLLPVVAAFALGGRAILRAGGAAAGFLARLAGREAPPAPEEAAEDEILDAVSEGERLGVIEDQEREMIESIIEFKDVEVAEVMTPRTELTTIDGDSSLRAMLPTAISSGHSRLPVWSGNADNVVGVLYVKDILKYMDSPAQLDEAVRSIMRAPSFVPETKMVRELLQEFRASSVHMAIILDEYGGTSGIVTIEDILEEIVGDIEDEYDEYEPPDIRSTGRGRAVVMGSAGVDEVNDELGTQLSESDEYETVAGYVLFRTGRIPAKGEVFEWEGVRFSVLDADERRIDTLAVERYGEASGARDEEGR